MNEYNEAIDKQVESLENLLKAIDIIAGSKLNNIPCDKTEICIVQGKKNDAINTNTYMVSNGSLQFEAVVDAPLGSKDAPKYKKNDSVRVLIPNGNYQETKYITGLHVADINNPTAYISPQDAILNITGNLFTENKTYGLAANNEEESEIYIGEIDLIQNSMYRNNYQAYDTLILSANFKSLFESRSGISGSYGLRLELYPEITDETGNIEKLLERTVVLDSSDMMGNPYLFQIDSIQSIKFNIPDLEKRLAGGKLYFYQKNNFNYLTESGMKNKVSLSYLGGSLVKNLFVSNINLSFGADISKIEGKQFKIFTNGNTDYSNNDLQKSFSSLWYNKDNNNKYIGFSDGVHDAEYDELTYRKQMAEEQKLQSQLLNSTIETSTDVRGITLSSHYLDITNIYNEMYEYLDKKMFSTLKSFLNKIRGIKNDNLQTLISKIEGTEDNNSYGKCVNDFKNTYELVSSFYKGVLAYAKQWQTAESKPNIEYGEGKVPEKDNRKTVFDLAAIAKKFEKYVSDFEKYKSVIDEYIYSSYISQMKSYYKKIEKYCIELEKFELDKKNFRKDSTELNFYLTDESKNYKFSDNLYKKDEEWHKKYANKYCIYWYRYNPNYENVNNEEMLAGPGWERLTKAADGMSLVNFGIPPEGENGYNKVYSDNNVFSLQMDLDKINEKITAILFYNHEMYKSNILEFTNLTPSSSAINLDGINALSIVHGANSRNIYQCYGIDNQIMRSSDASTTRHLKLQYEGTKGGNEVLLGATIEWYLPKNSTMLTYNKNDVIVEPKETDTHFIFTCEKIETAEDASLPYRIKHSYLSSFSNNTIKCKVILSDGEVLETEMFFTFATGEANGTGYAFVVSPKTDKTHVSSITIGNGNSDIDTSKSISLELSINIYNGNGKEIPIDNIKNTITAKWLCCKYTTTENVVEEKDYYKLTFKKDEITGNIIGCTIEPKRGWGGPGIIKFIADIKAPINENEEGESYKQQTLTTYYTVPWCPSGISYYMEGATSVIYNSFGTNPTNYTGSYRLFYNQNVYDENNNIIHWKDEEVSDVQWKMRYYIFNNEVYEDDSNKYNQSFIDRKDNKNYYEIDDNIIKIDEISSKYKLLANYLPKIEQQTLKPSNMYLDGLFEEGDNSINDIRNGNLYPAVLAYTKEENELDKVLWIQPIILMQNAYSSSALNKWDGSLTIDDENNTVFSSIIGAGRKISSNNTFEGVLMGDVGKTDSGAKMGLYGYHNGAQSFGFKTDGTAFIGKSGAGRIEFNGTKSVITSNSKLLTIDLDDGYIKLGTENSEDFLGLYANDNASPNKQIGPMSQAQKFWRLIAGNNTTGISKTGIIYTSNIQASGGTIGGWTIFNGYDSQNKRTCYLGSTGENGSMYLTTIEDNNKNWIRTISKKSNGNNYMTFSIDRNGHVFTEKIDLYDNSDTTKISHFLFNADNSATYGNRIKLYTNKHSNITDTVYAGLYIGEDGISYFEGNDYSHFRWIRKKTWSDTAPYSGGELLIQSRDIIFKQHAFAIYGKVWITPGAYSPGMTGSDLITLPEYIRRVVNGTIA